MKRPESIGLMRLVLVLVLCQIGWVKADCQPAGCDTTDADTSVTAPDPYAHFEAMESPEIKAWAKKQNTVARHLLDGLPSREYFKSGIIEYYQSQTVGVPVKTRKYFYYQKSVPQMNHHVVVRAVVIGENEEVVINPNTWPIQDNAALSGWTISATERYLAYGVTHGGSDWRTWHILDLTNLNLLDDNLKGIKWNYPTWAPDDVGLFYSGYSDRSHNESASGKGNRIYYHTLGGQQSDDIEVFKPTNDKHVVSLGLSESYDYVRLRLSKSSDGRIRTQLYPLADDWQTDPAAIFLAKHPHVLSPDFAWREWEVGNSPGASYLFTEKDAPLGRIDRYDLKTRTRQTIVPERPETLVGVRQVGEYLFAEYVKDVKSFVLVYDLEGTRFDEIKLPFDANIWGFYRGRAWHKEAYFAASGYANPQSIFRYRFKDKSVATIWSSTLAQDTQDLTSRQDFYTANDGTQIPLFIVHRKSIKLDGQRPTILFGYGCYGYLTTISFNTARLPWLLKGGVFAVANIRGGGAYGDAWHSAGKAENKQTSVDDFIAAAHWLTDKRYTSPSHLTVSGGSCGGLLVGAAATQRPELFAAAVPQVGILDLMRYHKFTGAYLWESELGSAENESQRPHLRALSPLIGAQQKRRYPAMLITTRMRDTRVVPMHSYKFAAALQEHQTGSAPIVLRVDEQGGHSLGRLPVDSQIDYLADIYAFAWDMTRVSRK